MILFQSTSIARWMIRTVHLEAIVIFMLTLIPATFVRYLATWEHAGLMFVKMVHWRLTSHRLWLFGTLRAGQTASTAIQEGRLTRAKARLWADGSGNFRLLRISRWSICLVRCLWQVILFLIIKGVDFVTRFRVLTFGYLGTTSHGLVLTWR